MNDDSQCPIGYSKAGPMWGQPLPRETKKASTRHGGITCKLSHAFPIDANCQSSLTYVYLMFSLSWIHLLVLFSFMSLCCHCFFLIDSSLLLSWDFVMRHKLTWSSSWSWNNLFLKILLKNKEFKEAMNLEVVKLSTRYLLWYHLLDQVASE